MKVSKLLHSIDSLINSHKQTNRKHNQFSNIFTAYVLQKLKFILEQIIAHDNDKELNQQDVDVLSDFLREIYAIIRQTDLIPSHAPKAIISLALKAVAEALAEFTDKSKYEFLFPNLNITQYDVSTTTLKDSDLYLHSFILSDDETKIIEVYACLSFAVDDGILKHTYLRNGQSIALSDNEQQRLLQHSKVTREYWNAIARHIDLITNGESVAAVLLRLCKGLRAGGKNQGNGQELDSGSNANIALVEFFTWFNALTDEERSKISKLRGRTSTAVNKPRTLGDILASLFNEQAVDLNATRYCVELIADEIEDVIWENPELYRMYPENSALTEQQSIYEAQKVILEADAALKEALASGTYTVFSTYGANAKNVFISRVLQIKDLIQFAGDELQRYFWNKEPLNILDLNLTGENICAFLNILHEANIRKYYTLDTIKKILRMMSHDEQKIHLMKLLDYNLLVIIISLDIYDDFIGEFPECRQFMEELFFNKYPCPLFKKYSMEFFKRLFIINGEEHSNFKEATVYYLITGEFRYGFASELPSDKRIPYILSNQKLMPFNAVNEVNGLSIHQLNALLFLYAFGLRGDHLRTYNPANNKPFTFEHTLALERLMRHPQHRLDPVAAMNAINGVSAIYAQGLGRNRSPKPVLIYQYLSVSMQRNNETELELSKEMQAALSKLQPYGLQEEHLKKFKSPVKGAFTSAHTAVLEHLMRDHNPPYSPEDAVERISGLNHKKVTRLRNSLRM